MLGSFLLFFLVCDLHGKASELWFWSWGIKNGAVSPLPPAARWTAGSTSHREGGFFPALLRVESCRLLLFLLVIFAAAISLYNTPWLLPPSPGSEFEVGYSLFLRTVGEDGEYLRSYTAVHCESAVIRSRRHRHSTALDPTALTK